MRLIDADTLPSALFQKHVHDEEELEPMLYFEDAVGVVENAPTIDAIPVEWLKNRRNIYLKAYHAGHESELHIASILNDTLQAWQKEQEAKDG